MKAGRAKPMVFMGLAQCAPKHGGRLGTDDVLEAWEDNCKRVRDSPFSIQTPILGYLKKMAANITHDYFKHCHSQSAVASRSSVRNAATQMELRLGTGK
jgi:hypothetical protein